MTTFTLVNEANLVSTIQGCCTRLVYIAPGLTQPIADAIGEICSHSPMPSITVIVDIDAEVCRLGYGTVEGLKALQTLVDTHHIGIRYQAGLRVGVLVCDDHLMVYAPTPLLIEAGSTREDQPNAIMLGNQPLSQVLQACAAEGTKSENSLLPSNAEIGSVPATPAMLAESLQDLERLPPKPYDVSRAERVFNSKLQYVDFEVTGYKLSSRRVPIPNDLLVGDDKTLKDRLRNNYTLLEGNDVLEVEILDHDPKTNEPVKEPNGELRKVKYSEKLLEEERKRIYEDFMTNVPGYGWLIMRARRNDFDKRIQWFRTRIGLFQTSVSKELQTAIKESVEKLAQILLPSLKTRMPDRLKKYISSSNPSDENYLRALKAELSKAFGVGERFFNPEAKVIFKDLTYETIQDNKFRDALTKAMQPGGGDEIVSELFEEYDAAPECGSSVDD